MKEAPVERCADSTYADLLPTLENIQEELEREKAAQDAEPSLKVEELYTLKYK